MKSSLLIWHLLHNVKSTEKISSIFVAFLENMNFTYLLRSSKVKCDSRHTKIVHDIALSTNKLSRNHVWPHKEVI